MGIKKVLCLLLLGGILFFNSKTAAGAVFEINTDPGGDFLNFGSMELGEFKELKDRGEYQNEVICRSDRGQTWYLKIHLMTILRWGTNEISPENFKWKVVDVINGNGYAVNRNNFNDFSNTPTLVYTSAPEDNTGKEVRIRFTYGLQIPRQKVKGNYQAFIRYTLTETL